MQVENIKETEREEETQERISWYLDSPVQIADDVNKWKQQRSRRRKKENDVRRERERNRTCRKWRGSWLMECVSCCTVRARFDTNNNIPPVSLRCILSGRRPRPTGDRADMHTGGKQKDGASRQHTTSNELVFNSALHYSKTIDSSLIFSQLGGWMCLPGIVHTSAAHEISCVKSVSDLRNRFVGVQGISCPLRWILSRTP